jgi:hypothetical protein
MALDDPDMPMTGLVPTKEELESFLNLSVRPHERDEWKYSFLVPDGWYQQPPPPGRPDVTAPTEFIPLGVYTAAEKYMPPVLFSVGVRPAPKAGVVAEWLEEQCRAQSLALQRMTAHEFLFGWGADAVALQASDLGPLKLRVVMFEDGGRLFALTAMAPVDLWEAFVEPLSLMILTFELASPKGPTVPVFRKPPGADAEPPAAPTRA